MFLIAGCKKIQQELARPEVLKRFCDDAAQAERVRAVFAGLYALEEDKTYDMVVANPEQFVIKPQREGGGTLHRRPSGGPLSILLKTFWPS